MDDINTLINRHNALTQEHKKVSDSISLVKGELNARKNELKRLMDTAREAGVDPNNLSSEVKRLSEVLVVKLDTFEKELKAAKTILDPMVKEISNA